MSLLSTFGQALYLCLKNTIHRWLHKVESTLSPVNIMSGVCLTYVNTVYNAVTLGPMWGQDVLHLGLYMLLFTVCTVIILTGPLVYVCEWHLANLIQPETGVCHSVTIGT